MSFRDYMRENYNQTQMREIVTYGCQSGIATTMIYYSDTTAIYDEYADELHEIIEQCAKDFGEFPKFIIDNFGDTTQFRNAVVWLCAEIVAQEECE